jgi:spore cortex formation protein SpoVR/YcgB (stage V sporulation)
LVANISPELEQGRAIYQFLKKNVDCPIYYQTKLSARESLLIRDTNTGIPKYFILPFPYSYDRQLAVLHEYGHYLDKRPEKDVNLRSNLGKRKAIKIHKGIRKVFTQTELIAWANAIMTIVGNEWIIPQETYVDLIAKTGLQTYYDTWAKNGGLPVDLKEEFDTIFWSIDAFLSPGFLKIPAIQNYFSD